MDCSEQVTPIRSKRLQDFEVSPGAHKTMWNRWDRLPNGRKPYLPLTTGAIFSSEHVAAVVMAVIEQQVREVFLSE